MFNLLKYGLIPLRIGVLTTGMFFSLYTCVFSESVWSFSGALLGPSMTS